MINVGYDIEFPNEKQQAHTIVTDLVKHPIEGIQYGFYHPDKKETGLIYKNSNDFDILHAFDKMLITNNNWIGMTANVQFMLNIMPNGIYHDRQTRINIITKLLQKPNLKKMIFYSETGLQSVSNYAKITDPNILNKCKAVYCAVNQPDDSLLNQKHDKFRILFIGTAFYLKGGASLIDAFEILQKKYPFIELELHTSLLLPNYLEKEIYIPLDHNRTVHQIKNNPSITIYNSFEYSREQILREVYPRADLFILPSIQEGLGYVVQEAMSYGLPIILTNNTPSVPEIMQHNENGLVIDIKNDMSYNVQQQKIISQSYHNYIRDKITEYISLLIENPKLRKDFGKNNLEKARKLFSFQTRNKIMKQIYEESI